MRNRFSWRRPTSRTYAYNLDLGDHYYTHIRDYVESTPDRSIRGETPGAMTFAERLHYKGIEGRRYEAEDVQKRYARAASTDVRDVRSSTAPPVNVGFKGYYARQLEAAKAVAALEAAEKKSATASQTTAASASAKSTATAEKKTVTISEKTTTASKKEELASLQKSSVEYGRSSASRAVRRAEQHAATSAKDPRHVMVPWDITDDICKKVADIHMAPYAKGEAETAAQASLARWSKVNKMESDLEALTKTAMTYSSCYKKSAAQMAKEAMSEDASAVASSYKKTKKTIVESSSKKSA